jgi:hypothetical protein
MANDVIRAGIGSAKTSPVANCTDVGGLLQSGSMAGFAIAAQPVAPDQVVTCTVDHVAPGSSTAATFLAHGVS